MRKLQVVGVDAAAGGVGQRDGVFNDVVFIGFVGRANLIASHHRVNIHHLSRHHCGDRRFYDSDSGVVGGGSVVDIDYRTARARHGICSRAVVR